MHEDSFLRSILDNPWDNSLLQVYADWLEDQGGSDVAAKVEFLRLTAAMTTLPAIEDRQRDARWQRLQRLAARLGPAWLAIVSRLPVESCQGKRREAELAGSSIRFSYVCDLRWEDMQASEDRAVRFCASCQHNVHYCGTIKEAQDHARKGNCIAMDLRLNRSANDLEPVRMVTLGIPRSLTVEERQEQRRPEAVPAEQQRRNRNRDQENTAK